MVHQTVLSTALAIRGGFRHRYSNQDDFLNDLDHFLSFARENVVRGSAQTLNFGREMLGELDGILSGIAARLSDSSIPYGSSVASKYDLLPRVIKAILVANIGVYLCWLVSNRFMRRHATSSLENARAGRLWTFPISAISHRSLVHLLFNMYSFLNLAPVVLAALGERLFCMLVLVSASVGGLLPLIHSKLTISSRRRAEKVSEVYLGFSGVNSALLVLYTLLRPAAQLTSPFAMLVSVFSPGPLVETVSAVEFLRTCILSDLAGALLAVLFLSTGISHASHLGGYLAAFAMQWFICETTAGQNLAPWGLARRLDWNLVKELQQF